MQKITLKITAVMLAVIIAVVSAPLQVWAAFLPANAAEKQTVIVILDDGVSPNETAAAMSAQIDGMKVKYLYNTLINGFSAEVDSDSIDIIDSYSGVISVSSENVYTLPAVTLGEQKITDEAISLRADDDYGGEGTVVAVLDNGFDVSHKAFRLSSVAGISLSKEEVAAARFSLDAHTDAYVSPKLPFVYDYAGDDKNVYTADAHGTGVAGIIAGNSDVYKGVVPEAQLLLMKVFGDDGSAKESDVIAALEDAVKLGADVVNLSLGSTAGSDSGEPLDPALGIALDAAIKAGVTVNGAVGNDGHIGRGSEIDNDFGLALPSVLTPDYGTVNSPASVGSVTAIASKNSDADYKYCVEFGNKQVPFTDTSSNYKSLGEKSFTASLGGKTYKYIAVPGLGTAEDCAQVGDKLKGAIALIKRGELTFVEKVKNAYKYGAVGVIVWDNIENNPSVVNMDLTGAPIPAIFISYEYGAPLYEAGEGEVKVTDKLLGRFTTADSGKLAQTTSWGMTPSFALKPELSATGENVCVILPGNNYGTMSGTSAASAVASGEAAVAIGLLRGDGEDTAPASLKRRLMNSAVLLTDPETKVYYSPRRQGAGEANGASAAELQTSLVSTSTGLAKFELPSLDSANTTLELTLTNTSDHAVTYTLSCAVQGDDYKLLDDNTNTTAADLCVPRVFENATATLDGKEINQYNTKFTGTTVIVGAGESLDFKVTIALDTETASEYAEIFKNGYYLEGFVIAQPLNGDGSVGDCVSLPYVCFVGDWDSLPVFDATVYDSDSESYYFNSCFYSDSEEYSFKIILGLNQYMSGNNFDSSCISFSPDNNGELDTINLSMSLLRSARDITGEVIASDGEVVADMGKLSYLSKTTIQNTALTALDFMVWDGTSVQNPYFVFPDGKYTLVINAYPAFEGSTLQKYVFPFTVDTKKPKVTSEKLQTAADGSQSLILGVADETSLQGAILYLSDSGFKKGDYLTAHTSGLKTSDTYKFDVTGWKEKGTKYVYIDLYDYAMNRLTVKIELAALSGGTK
jgi:Subtilisin-like serine proteases